MDGLDVDWVRAVTGRLLEKHDWQLAVPPEEFFQAVVWELRLKHSDPALITAEKVERVVKRCYSRVLYRATGAAGTPEQARGYHELRVYLAACARHLLYDEQAEADTAQQAIANIIARHADCADADAFLGWCRQIAVNVVRDRHRRRVHAYKIGNDVNYLPRQVSFEEWGGEAEPGLRTGDVAGETGRILYDALRGPMYEALLKALWDCLEKASKVRVIVEIFLHGKSVPELARELSESALKIQMTKYRALETLRECKEMKKVFQDWDA